MARVHKLLFVVNLGKPGARELAAEMSAEATKAGVASDTVDYHPLEAERLDDVDLCIVIGGDGTLLGVMEAASARKVPVLGVNLGRLGFMASFSPESLRTQFANLLEGRFSHRSLAVLQCHSASEGPVHALNDIVIKAIGSHLIHLSVYCESEHVNTYHADGLIFATPTGSTAYSLSAGGPIVHPSANVLTLTPINPHTLSNRAIVLDDSHALRIECRDNNGPVQVAADGREIFTATPKFPIEVRIAPNRRFRLVQPADYSHYFVLRNKLRWTGDAIFPTQP
jgi:NAD+ kinase